MASEEVQQYAAKRGYMGIKVKSRGSVGKNLRKAYPAASKQAWIEVGKFYHEHMRDKRFTPAHARAAKYALRAGQLIPKSNKLFRRFYYGKKWASPSHGGGPERADPLVFTGRTRRAVRSASIASTSKGSRVRYSGASALNFKTGDEFRRILRTEARVLGKEYNRFLDKHLKQADK